MQNSSERARYAVQAHTNWNSNSSLSLLTTLCLHYAPRLHPNYLTVPHPPHPTPCLTCS